MGDKDWPSCDETKKNALLGIGINNKVLVKSMVELIERVEALEVVETNEKLINGPSVYCDCGSRKRILGYCVTCGDTICKSCRSYRLEFRCFNCEPKEAA